MTRYFSDANAMVVAFCTWHEHHPPTVAQMERRESAGEQLVLAAHSLPEAYAVPRRLPGTSRLRSRDAIALLAANWRSTPVTHLTVAET